MIKAVIFDLDQTLLDREASMRSWASRFAWLPDEPAQSNQMFMADLM